VSRYKISTGIPPILCKKKEEKRGFLTEKEAYSFRSKKTKTHGHNNTINSTKLARY
jgi:hypothetical protein